VLRVVCGWHRGVSPDRRKNVLSSDAHERGR
jgi:hypothetical protein